MGSARTGSALLSVLTLLCVGAALPGQRPRTVDEALARLAQVADRAEAEQVRPVGDLGGFDDVAATNTLLAVFARAQGLALRQAAARALGEQVRPAAVAPLRDALAAATNARFCETLANALARQGDPGVQALVDALEAENVASARRNAICDGLGRATGDAARDALLAEITRTGGRDRLPPLRGLRARSGDAKVDELRVLLTRDGDVLVAATALQQLAEHAHPSAAPLAVDLGRRLAANADAGARAAVLHGLLRSPQSEHGELLLAAAAGAEDPFGKQRLPLWRAAMEGEALVRWFAEQGPVRKAAAERAAAAHALGLVPPAHHDVVIPSLARLLADRETEVVRAAAQALAGLETAAALPPLQKQLAGSNEVAASIALVALHTRRHQDAAWIGELFGHANGKSTGVRVAALQLLARTPDVDEQQALSAAGANLLHKAWPPRAAAIQLLVALRAAAAVPLLFERLDAEQGRLRHDVATALQEQTALQFPTSGLWRERWQKEGATFRVAAKKPRGRPGDERRGGPTAATYWNLPVHSDRVAFVVDASGSMAQPFGTGDQTRLDEAKRQLARVLEALPAKGKANVIAFADGAKSCAEALQLLDDRRRAAAAAFARGLAARGATNVHDGLQLAFADAEVDTIFLLTDGQPSAGPVVDEEALLRTVAGWNAGRGICIHTVAIGGRSRLLERLAEQSGGEHTVAR